MADSPNKRSQKLFQPGFVTPVKKTRLYMLTQSQPVDQDLAAAEMGKLNINTKGNGPGVQHQRQHSDYVMRSTFIPPESPNELSPRAHFKSLGQHLSDLKPTTPNDVYGGVSVRNTYVENALNEHTLCPSNEGSTSSVTDCVEDLTFTPSSAHHGTSFDTSVDSTPSKGVKTSNRGISGVEQPTGSSTPVTRISAPTQTKTFEQLAREQGVRAWDSKNIDDRWALNINEVHRKSPVSYEQGVSDEDMGYFKRHGGQFKARAYCVSPIESENGGVALGAFNDPKPAVKATANNKTQNYLPLPTEMVRLEKLVSDVTNAAVRIEKPFCSRITKLYFNDRVFGSQDGPEPLSNEEASQMTFHQGKAKTFAELRCETLGAIDDLAEWYSSPAGQGTRDRDRKLAQIEAGSREALSRVGNECSQQCEEPTKSVSNQASTLDTAPVACNSGVPFQYHNPEHSMAFNNHVGYSNTQHNQTMQVPMQMWQGQYAGTPNFRAPGNYPQGICIPGDRFARPPASNRRAPLFAQSGAWQTNNPNHQKTPRTLMTPFDYKSNLGSKTLQDNRRLLYVEGSDAMHPTTFGASIRFQSLTKCQPPNYASVTHMSNVPFVETARSTKPAEWGVLKLGNIPYDMTKASVYQFLGSHAKIITPDFGPSVHIIMDRATGKTQDCYVEFFSVPDAQVCQRNIQNRGPGYNRINDRLIDVTMSSQDQILAELFPRAKNVVWTQGQPVIQTPQEPYNTGFKTFLSGEELGVLVRHVEQPQRCNYIAKCHNRPYEAMISLLAKFPWQAVDQYTLATRNKIFEAVYRMLEVLCREVRRSSKFSNAYRHAMQLPYASLDSGLFRDLFSAAINCPFSERQRWALYLVGRDVMDKEAYRVSPLLQFWPFEVLGRTRHIEDDVVEWYAKLMASHPQVQTLSNSPPDGPFGRVRELYQADDSKTMDVIGSEEWNIMGRLIAEMCDPSMWDAATAAAAAASSGTASTTSS